MSFKKFGPIHPSFFEPTTWNKQHVEIYQIIINHHKSFFYHSKEDFGHSWNPLEPAGVQIEVLGLQLQWQPIVAKGKGREVGVN